MPGSYEVGPTAHHSGRRPRTSRAARSRFAGSVMAIRERAKPPDTREGDTQGQGTAPTDRQSKRGCNTLRLTRPPGERIVTPAAIARGLACSGTAPPRDLTVDVRARRDTISKGSGDRWQGEQPLLEIR